jgi:hypothetical protein
MAFAFWRAMDNLCHNHLHIKIGLPWIQGALWFFRLEEAAKSTKKKNSTGRSDRLFRQGH